MKKHFAVFALVFIMQGLVAPPVLAQGESGTVKGVCKDTQGNPIAEGVVVWANYANSLKYTFRTNKNGEYFSPGVGLGYYTVTLYKSEDDAKADKEIAKIYRQFVAAGENTVDFDMAVIVAEREELKILKALNEKLAAAKFASDAGDYETAIANLIAANQIDATRNVIWFSLGETYRMSAGKQTDPAEKQKRLDLAVDSYQKAVQLEQAANDKDPNANKYLAVIYNNLAEADSGAGKIDDSIKNYQLAVQTDPTAAAQYYFNMGAALTNANLADKAIAAFDKCIAADPTKAEAYYWKGVNLIGKATLQGDKMVAVPGTAEAFQKYLELVPTGGHSEEAKEMLTAIGAPISIHAH